MFDLPDTAPDQSNFRRENFIDGMLINAPSTVPGYSADPSGFSFPSSLAARARGVTAEWVRSNLMRPDAAHPDPSAGRGGAKINQHEETRWNTARLGGREDRALARLWHG